MLKNHFKIAFLALLVSVVFSERGMSGVTAPCGYMTYSIPATPGVGSAILYFSLPLLSYPIYAGTISSFTSTTLTVAGTPWTFGQLATTSSPYFVKITSGAEAGRFLLITANTTNTITLDITDFSTQSTGLDTSGFSVSNGDNFQIIPGDTVASLFGDNSPSNPLLLRGGSAFTADSISYYDPRAVRFYSYYFNTTSNMWLSTSFSGSQNNSVIYPEMVVGINRRGNGAAMNFVLNGEAPDVAPLIKTIGGGSTIYSSSSYPMDLTLATLNFSGWLKSTSASTADNIGIWSAPLSRFQIYYQLPDAGGVPGQWRQSGGYTNDSSNLAVPAGTGIQIIRPANLSGSASFLYAPLPY